MTLEQLEEKLRGREPGLMDASGQYAVLVPLVEREGKLHILYEVRSQDMRRQPGEVCFPGGRIEGDETPEACAIRETEEELGIPTASITVLGRLDFVAHRANFIMYPVLARVETAAAERMALNPAEVDHTFLVPLAWLRDHPPAVYIHRQPVSISDFPYEDAGVSDDYLWRPYYMEVPVYHGLPHPLWGLTARITMDVVAHL